MRDKICEYETNKPRLVSLFSGCGGMDVGFDMAGFHRVFANDFDEDAQRVFSLNLGKIDPRDIRTITSSEIPECDILTAGFPCQPFSNAGMRKGVDDPRGKLYLECLRIVLSKMPKVVVFENVKGLMSSKNKDGSSLALAIKSDLEKIGYTVSMKILKASDYEVPQNRERLIFVGVLKTLGIDFVFPAPIPKTDKLLLGNVLNLPKDLSNQEYWPFSPQAQKLVEQIPEGGSWKSIPYDMLPDRLKRIRDQMSKYHAPNFYRRFSRNEISGTITASAQPENCGIIHPIENRRYSVREIARIQTFPDDFLFFTDSLKDVVAMYKVIGNAVPCKLAYHLAKAIKAEVFNGD